MPSVGEYVAVEILTGTSQALVGRPLFRTNLATFVSLYGSALPHTSKDRWCSVVDGLVGSLE